LVALVNPDHFATSFDLLLKDTGLSAALLQLDLRLIAASETVSTPMGSLPGQAASLAKMLQATPFDQRLTTGLAGEPAVLAHRNARLAPWLVTVEEPLAQADEPFRALALEALLAWSMVMAVIAAVAGLALKSAREHERQRVARKAARRELARQHVLTANLIDASANALYSKDTEGRLLMANQAWGRWVGLEPQRLMGAPLPDSLAWADPTSPEGSDVELRARGGVVTFEVQLTGATGPRDVLVSKVAVHDDTGDVVAVVGSLTDVSTYREAERHSRDAAEAARQANDAKSEFVANISHELRTPLQSILGFSEIGQVRCTDSPAAQGYFKRVHAAGKHMLSLVEDLLDLAKPELTAAQMNLELLPLGGLAAEVLEELASQAHRKSIRIGQHGLGQELTARVERRGFQQVVRNLVANALRFAPEGSTVEVALGAGEGDGLRLTVSDRGPGVPAAEMESIFAPFVQSSVTKTNAGGTGLGLSICRRLVEAFGGRVWAEARPGGGAVFVVELPRG
jgi:PAS domain S-box-containing protein